MKFPSLVQNCSSSLEVFFWVRSIAGAQKWWCIFAEANWIGSWRCYFSLWFQVQLLPSAQPPNVAPHQPASQPADQMPWYCTMFRLLAGRTCAADVWNERWTIDSVRWVGLADSISMHMGLRLATAMLTFPSSIIDYRVLSELLFGVLDFGFHLLKFWHTSNANRTFFPTLHISILFSTQWRSFVNAPIPINYTKVNRTV